jgi:hypothetical protein
VVTAGIFPGPTSYSVPVGQQLVIEYISALCVPVNAASATGPGANVSNYGEPSILVSTNGAVFTHYLPMPVDNRPFGTASFGVTLGTATKIYADPGSTISINNSAPITTPNCAVTGSGRLVTP